MPIQLENDLVFSLATASKCNTVKWKNSKTTWENLVNQLSETIYTDETVAEYAAMSGTKEGKDKQGKIKDVGGFVGGYLREGRRLKGYVEHRQLIALDIDFGDTDVWNEFLATGYAGACYSTHKHTPENPRLRLLVPLSRQVEADEYEACARQVAAWFDIDKFDDTTFQPERLMYYPSTPKDGEYFFAYNDGVILDPAEALDQLDDWRDPTTWATSSRVTEARRVKRADKAEDPTTKKGIIGAFCRAYTIEDAVSEFLSDVYEPCDNMGKGRYTYINGSTFGGLVVYDNTFCTSHHGTDPISSYPSCNSFDLVRLHKFGDKDEPMKDYPDHTKRPSFKAMAEWAATLDDVKVEAVAGKQWASADEYDSDADVIGSKRDPKAGKRKTGNEWMKKLDVDNNGKPRPTIDNVVKILYGDPLLEGCFAYDEFHGRDSVVRSPPWSMQFGKYPRVYNDRDTSNLYAYFENYGITKRENIDTALDIVFGENAFNPVKQYMDSCEWDGEERLDTIFVRLFGADDTEYTRAVTRKWFCAGVARAYVAGTKFDNMIVLVGEQGTGKSTVMRRMANGWFSESITDVTHPNTSEAMQGKFIIELPELTGMRKAEVNGVKQFLSKEVDSFRSPYGRRTNDYPRRCIFVGTTNEANFLRDTTGNRRFWVINCLGKKGTDYFYTWLTTDMVSQLWGEAKHYYAAGEELCLSRELEDEAAGIQREHLEVDERAGMVGEYLERLLPINWDKLDPYARREWLNDPDKASEGKVERTRVSLAEIWFECLGFEHARLTMSESKKLAPIMSAFPEWMATPNGVRIPFYGQKRLYIKNSII